MIVGNVSKAPEARNDPRYVGRLLLESIQLHYLYIRSSTKS